eukprot:4278187-Amphidinium_carterae.1
MCFAVLSAAAKLRQQGCPTSAGRTALGCKCDRRDLGNKRARKRVYREFARQPAAEATGSAD